MLQVCNEPGCSTLTMGALCLLHEPPVGDRIFPRGRPYPLEHREVLVPAALLGKTTDLDVVLLEGAT